MSARRLILVPVLAAAFVLGSLATYYTGGRYIPPNTPLPDVKEMAPPVYPSPAFTDVPQKRRGTLLVDEAHFNNFGEQEISILLSRVAARGYRIEFVGSLSTFFGSDERERERERLLEAGLRGADAYLVALPWNEFTLRERELVRNFVERGGRVLLVSDPTRRSEINSLAQDFGIIYTRDYLYNIKEHEANFQFIYLRDFAPHELTKGLRTLVFYIASSLAPESGGLVFTDANTFSSLREQTGRFSPVVQAARGRVIAISDLSFMAPPYNSVMDNDRLLSNIADFLTISERVFFLAEFPHFFGPQVDVVVGRDELLGNAQSLIALLTARDRTAELREREDFLRETAFLGLWQDASLVEHYLAAAGIRVGKTITTPFGPETRREGTALIFLHENQGRHILIILGDSRDTVAQAIARLKSGQFRQGLVSDNLGLYPLAEAAPAEKTPTPRRRE